jgi:hypothetical protein
MAALEKRGCSVRINWLPRQYNAAADSASKQALIDTGITLTERKPPPGYTPRLGDIGGRLAISAVKVGRILDAAGLRADRAPTDRALKNGLARQRFDGFGVVTDWNIEKVLTLVGCELNKRQQELDASESAQTGSRRNVEPPTKAKAPTKVERKAKLQSA